MVSRFEAIWYADISELREQRDASVIKYADLSDKLQHLNAELEKKDQKLSGLKREFVVAKRQIKDAQNVIFNVNIKRSKVDETAYSFMQEFESTETELAELKNKKQAVETEIDTMRNSLQEVSRALVHIDTEKKKDVQEVARLSEEKSNASDELAKFLSKTSLEREEIDKKFEDLNITFMGSMEGREAARQRLDNLKTKDKMLAERVEKLKQRFASLEEVKVLQNEMISLQTEVAKREKEFLAVDSKLKERQMELTAKRDQLDLLRSENSDQKEKIDSMEEKVKVYRETLGVFDAAQENFDTAKALFKEGSDAIMKILAQKIYLEKDLQAILEKIDILEHLKTELVPQPG